MHDKYRIINNMDSVKWVKGTGQVARQNLTPSIERGKLSKALPLSNELSRDLLSKRSIPKGITLSPNFQSHERLTDT